MKSLDNGAWLAFQRFAFALLFLMLLPGCSENNSEHKTEPSVFNVYIGMPETRVHELYPNCSFKPESANKFGLCSGGEDGVSVFRNDSLLFHYWKISGEDKVLGYILFDPNQSHHGVHVGMTIGDFLQLYPNAISTISHMDSREYLFVSSEDNWYQIESSLDDLAAEYSDDQGEYQFEKFQDLDKTISHIFVKND